MTYQDPTSQATEDAEGGVTQETAERMFGGAGRVERARPNGNGGAKPQVRVVEPEPEALPTRKYTRIAPHSRPVHLDEFAAAALIRLFPHQAEDRWPGIARAEFLPFDLDLEDARDLRDDEGVLKLGWNPLPNRMLREDVVDEHSLPDEERRERCTTTLVAGLLDLNSKDRFLLKPVLAEVLESDKRGRRPLSSMHLADLVMAPFTNGNGETYREVLQIVVWAVRKVMEKQQRFLSAAERLKPDHTWYIPGPRGLVTVHVLNYADSSELEQFEGAVTAVCRIRGAEIIVIRNPDGHIQVIGDPQKRLPMHDVALGLRAYECHLRGRNLPPLAELRRKGTIPEVPEWHFSDSGNVLLGGEAQPWTPATLLQLENVEKALEHVFDPAWMKAHGFV